MVLIILIMGEHLVVGVVTTSKNTGRPWRNYICLKNIKAYHNILKYTV